MARRNIVVTGIKGSGKSSLIQAIGPIPRDTIKLDEFDILSPQTHDQQRKASLASAIIVTIDMTLNPQEEIKLYEIDLSQFIETPKQFIFVCTKGDLIPSEQRKNLENSIQEYCDARLNKVSFANLTDKNDPGLRTIRLQLDIATRQDIVDIFLAEHQKLFVNDKREFFGSLRRSHINPNWSLNDIIHYAEKKDNRSRAVFVSLGWMDKQGKLTLQAPNEMKIAHEENLNELKTPAENRFSP